MSLVKRFICSQVTRGAVSPAVGMRARVATLEAARPFWRGMVRGVALAYRWAMLPVALAVVALAIWWPSELRRVALAVFALAAAATLADWIGGDR